MAVFFGTHENKVDRKGRVSVPASFRQALAASSYTGIVVRPSPRHQAIEGSDLEFMMALNESAQHNDIYSEEHDDLGFMLFAESFQLPFDPEGRVILPAELLESAGISDKAAFVGMGSSFQIWQPEALAAVKTAARERTKANGLSLSLKPKTGSST